MPAIYLLASLPQAACTSLPQPSLTSMAQAVDAPAFDSLPRQLREAIVASQTALRPQSPSHDAEVIRQRGPIFADGDTLTFSYLGLADSVSSCCVIRQSLQQLAPDLWAGSVRIRGLQQARLDISLLPQINGQAQTTTTLQWRGPETSADPLAADPLRGRLSLYRLASTALAAERNVRVYEPPGPHTGPLPVVYLTDAEWLLPPLAALVEPLILQGQLPPVLLVGVDAASPKAGADPRGEEYLWSRHSPQYARHAEFFVKELSLWAEQELAASPLPADRVVAGVSNGASFAASISSQHPRHFGYALVLSSGVLPPSPQPVGREAPAYYLYAGRLEPEFFTQTAALAHLLGINQVRLKWVDGVSGHQLAAWLPALVEGLRWALAQR